MVSFLRDRGDTGREVAWLGWLVSSLETRGQPGQDVPSWSSCSPPGGQLDECMDACMDMWCWVDGRMDL